MTAILPYRLLIARGPSGSNGVCLTFDDGPDPEFTPRLLDLLAKTKVPATFFLVGEAAERHPGLVRRIAEEGHVVGNHTFHHADARKTSPASYLAQVTRARILLRELSGQEVDLFRPPYGSLTIATLLALWRAGQVVVLWSIDPKDYPPTQVQAAIDSLNESPPRAGDIVLLHDRFPIALEVLTPLIRDVRLRGMDFTTPREWLR
jgi:peptidoglycan/xylan/chitin deacetylase (PgdA/CDA1 family)